MASLEAFIAANKDEIEILGNGKAKCLVTGHEMALDLKVMKKYWSGKSYKKKKLKRLKRQAEESIDLDEYEFIIPHKFNPKMAYCLLTKDTLNLDAKEIANHIKGRRYQHRLHDKLREDQAALARSEKAKSSKEDGEKEESSFWVPPDEGVEDNENGDDNEKQNLDDVNGLDFVHVRRVDASGGGKKKQRVTAHVAKSRGKKDKKISVQEKRRNKRSVSASKLSPSKRSSQSVQQGDLVDEGFEVVKLKNKRKANPPNSINGKHTSEGSLRTSSKEMDANHDEAAAVREAMASVAAAEIRMTSKKKNKGEGDKGKRKAKRKRYVQ